MYASEEAEKNGEVLQVLRMELGYQTSHLHVKMWSLVSDSACMEMYTLRLKDFSLFYFYIILELIVTCMYYYIFLAIISNVEFMNCGRY